MEPFFFESGDVEIFAAYHAPTNVNSRSGLIICPPYPSEQNRVFDALRQTALHWAASGHHVLRFDYMASGDSFGDWESAGPKSWIGNIEDAASELRDIAGVKTITILAPRFGGLLAAIAAKSSGASSLVLWDPVMSGEEHLLALGEVHQRLVRAHVNLSRSEIQQSQHELIGSTVASWMSKEMSALAIPSELPKHIERVVVINSTGEHSGKALGELWGGALTNFATVSVDYDCSWDADPEAILNAAPVVEELSKCA